MDHASPAVKCKPSIKNIKNELDEQIYVEKTAFFSYLRVSYGGALFLGRAGLQISHRVFK
jgi:hypothetical protein